MPVATVAPNLKHIWPHLTWLPEMTANLLGINACLYYYYCITAHLLFLQTNPKFCLRLHSSAISALVSTNWSISIVY